MSTELQEAVGGADTLDPQDVAPQRGHEGLRLRPGCDESSLGALHGGRPERLAIHLAARRKRKGVEPHER